MRYIVALLIGLIVLAGCAPKASPENNTVAKKITHDYYAALNAKDYRTMYSLISEGFKQIEPTARTYEKFEKHMARFFDTAKSITLKSTQVASATPDTVVVDYVADIVLLSGVTREMKSSFTVKKKPEGWRLIHPYGEKIDTL